MEDYEDIDRLEKKERKEAQEKSDVINSWMVGTFNTELGERCLTHLETVFVDRPMYKSGLTPDEVAYRQGQADIVRQLRKTLNEARGVNNDNR